MSHNKQRRGGGFRTDTDISRGAKAAKAGERELQAWQPDPDTSGAAGAGGLEDETFGAGSGKKGGGGGWDQFATNAKLFGATTTYNEDLYTTRLDRSTPGFREREKVAERLAGEIEGQVSTNVHVAEERGQKVAEDWDEEARFSGVKRGGSAYVPPGARRGEEKESKEVPKLVIPPKAPAAAVNVISPAATPSKTENMTDSLRRFAQTEREKIAQAKVDIAKTERERRLAELKAFGRSFKVPAKIDGKDKSTADKPSEKSEKPTEKPSEKPTKVEPVKPSAPTHASPSKPKIAMRIPEIPPFRGAAPPKVDIPVTADRAVPVVKPEVKEVKEVKPVAPVPALNPAAAAFAFKPNPSASSFKPVSTPRVKWDAR